MIFNGYFLSGLVLIGDFLAAVEVVGRERTTTLHDPAVQKNACHSTQLIIRSGFLLGLNLASRDSPVNCGWEAVCVRGYIRVSDKGNQRKTDRLQGLCQLQSGMASCEITYSTTYFKLEVKHIQRKTHKKTRTKTARKENRDAPRSRDTIDSKTDWQIIKRCIRAGRQWRRQARNETGTQTNVNSETCGS